MHFEKIKNKGQAQLFQSELMENMTKTHPVVIYSMYLPVIAFMVYYGHAYKGIGIGREIVLFLSGTLSWSFFGTVRKTISQSTELTPKPLSSAL